MILWILFLREIRRSEKQIGLSEQKLPLSKPKHHHKASKFIPEYSSFFWLLVWFFFAFFFRFSLMNHSDQAPFVPLYQNSFLHFFSRFSLTNHSDQAPFAPLYQNLFLHFFFDSPLRIILIKLPLRLYIRIFFCNFFWYFKFIFLTHHPYCDMLTPFSYFHLQVKDWKQALRKSSRIHYLYQKN